MPNSPDQSFPQLKAGVIGMILVFFAMPPFFPWVALSKDLPWQAYLFFLAPNAVVIGLYLATRGWLARQESFLGIGPRMWKWAPVVCYGMGFFTGLLIALGVVDAIFVQLVG